METPWENPLEKEERKGERRGRVIKDVPRATEALDTSNIRHCNGHYFLRCIPSTVITASGTQPTGVGTVSLSVGSLDDEEYTSQEDQEDDEGPED